MLGAVSQIGRQTGSNGVDALTQKNKGGGGDDKMKALLLAALMGGDKGGQQGGGLGNLLGQNA